MTGAVAFETARLVLRELTLDDAAFALELLNEPGWIRFIGDRGLRTVDDARAYLEGGPLSLYPKLGFGFWRVDRREDGAPVGICGLIKRDWLDDVDLGYALLARFERRGYAREAAAATIAHAREVLKLARLAAIVNDDNARSIALLETLGFRFERTIHPPGEDAVVRLYGRELIER